MKTAKVDEIRKSALDVLERVLTLRSSNDEDSAALQDCQEKATELKNALESDGSDLHPEAESLASGQHPLAALLTLISERQSQNSDRVRTLNKIVKTESWGDPLALAAVLGDLTLPSSPESLSAETETVDTEQLSSPVEDIDAEPEITPVEAQSTAESTPVKKKRVKSRKGSSQGSAEEQTEAQKIAKSILNSEVEERDSLPDLIWELIGEDKLGLAFHLVEYLEKSEPSSQEQLTSWLIQGVALGRYVRHDLRSGKIAPILIEDFGNFNKSYFVKDESERNRESSLLLAASALRPALLAPNTMASRILGSLHLGEGLNQLHEYCQTIGKYGSQSRALNAEAIKKVRDQTVGDDNMNSLRQEVESWLSQAGGLNMISKVARTVWRQWTQPDGPIHSMLVPVKENDESKLELVKEYARRFNFDPQKEVKQTKKAMPKLRGNKEIEYKALDRIITSTYTAVDFAFRWIDLLEDPRDSGKNFSQVQELKQNLSSRHDAVLEELSAAEKQSSVKIRAGISYCRAAVEDIRNLFDPNVSLPTEELAPKYILHADLLRIPSLPMKEDWKPDISDSGYKRLRDEILNLVANNSFDWRQDFTKQSKNKDHEATGRIIEYLHANLRTNPEKASMNIEEIEQLEEQREKDIAKCREYLEDKIKETRNQMENAVRFDLLGQYERENYQAIIVAIETNLKDNKIFRFKQEQEKLGKIKSEIDDKTKSVRQRLNSLELAEEHPYYIKISKLIDECDIITANEYIGMVENGKPISGEEADKDTFSDFFPQKVIDIADFLKDKNPSYIIQRVEVRESREKLAGIIDLRKLTKAVTDRAANMLKVWFKVKDERTINENYTRELLTSLGFDPLEFQFTQSKNNTCWIEVKTEIIRSSPVSTYGSTANGQYQILCVWGRPSVDDIINEVRSATNSSPVLVLFFGRLTETRRRELARNSQQNSRKRRIFVLIDDILMLYLCGESEPRLPTLLNCSLPFTYLDPFTITAGLVPPEIFYGRKKESESIKDSMGSCFVYGGRQLGKTALLRSVEQEAHKPQSGEIAYWLDLKSYGIGKARPIDYLWSILADKFKELDVIPAGNKSAKTDLGTLLQHIENWVNDKQGRRILLLLDEADDFLTSDGQDGFTQTALLKGAMDRTKRRFKVVFAGLHNVQRTTRLENHPLAHYGEAICIGPLLENNERREARNLIKKPFASIGYQLSSEDLVTRILAQTNYYPSLIQLYCKELLRYINQNHSIHFDPKTPPYQITESQVEEAYYKSKNLRQAIRDRFMWTLQLDQRYEVIAYAIAWDSIQSEKGMVDGLSVAKVEEEVRYWWPEGFEGKYTDDIHFLLDEMVGLGVLRETHAGAYALRSPNVVFLLGTEEEMAKQLLRPREALVEYDPKTFRSPLDNGTRRSPLTVEQESILRRWEHGVSIIFGSRAAGLDELKDSLVSAVGREFLIPINNISSLPDFTDNLKKIIDNREANVDATSIVLVSHTCDWNEDWIEEARQEINQLQSSTSCVRVAFIANPQKTWDLLEKNTENKNTESKSTESKSTETLDALLTDGIFLKPWHDAALRQWLEDCDLPIAKKEDRKKIREITGNWHILLQQFYQDCKSDSTGYLQKLGESLKQPEYARKFLADLGWDDSEPQRQQVLRILLQLTKDSAEEEEELIAYAKIENIPDPDRIVKSTLKWAEILQIAFFAVETVETKSDKKKKKLWRLDPLVARVLTDLEK